MTLGITSHLPLFLALPQSVGTGSSRRLANRVGMGWDSWWGRSGGVGDEPASGSPGQRSCRSCSWREVMGMETEWRIGFHLT